MANAIKPYLGPSGYETSIAGTGENALHAYFWPAERKEQPKAIVLLLHGSNTYIEFDFLKFQVCPTFLIRFHVHFRSMKQRL
jgi:hypothetical protein